MKISERSAVSQISPFYSNEPTSNVVKLLKALDAEMDRLTALRLWVQLQHEVASADGTQLDDVGALISAPRYAYETDAEYRARLTQHVATFQGAGTIPSIKQFFAVYLDVDESAVSVTEGFEDVVYWDNGEFWGNDATPPEDQIYWTSDSVQSGFFTVSIELDSEKFYAWNTAAGRNRLQEVLDATKGAGTIGRVALVDIGAAWQGNQPCHVTVWNRTTANKACQVQVV